MYTPQFLPKSKLKLPVNIAGKHFANNKPSYYNYFLQNDPVHKGKLAVLNFYLPSKYDDCVSILKDPRIVRNRTTATGGGRFPVPLPKSLNLLVASMINEDDPNHRRLRGLVHQAFVPSRLAYLEERIEVYTHELLDKMEKEREVDLMPSYALPIPVNVIAQMVGVEVDEVPQFAGYISALTEGLSGFSIAKTVISDLPKAIKFCRALIERKRTNPGNDILTGLILAEEDGDKLTEDELVGMLFLIIVAGYETTVHLITNGIQTLLTHPDQLQRLRDNPELIDSAVEEINRFNGPINGTKPGYPMEDIELRGVTLPRGKPIMPLLGAANFDPDVFEDPWTFDVGRTPNRHLGFGMGIHYCLGAPLARMETKIAIANLLERSPNLALAIEPDKLEIQNMPGWHRYKTMPIRMG